ncbi:hypothetical protein [uncultured Parvimonas sp.]|uniref:hypothetical protein n=1 Tax=uncultured Parvimonas sp. TaxID=747372 RepID=UPI002591F71F|nr:hypothetical protein [uncultured Parvimonas sp.]
MIKEFNERLNKNLKIESIFENPSSENFESVFNNGELLEFIFTFKNSNNEEIEINDGFGMRNLSSNFENFDFAYGYKDVYVKDEYRGIGVMSLLMLKSILPLIKAKKDKSFYFYLLNTSKIFEYEIEKFKLYDSILKLRKGENEQYRIFSIEDREKDIEELEKLLQEKEKSVNEFFKNK